MSVVRYRKEKDVWFSGSITNENTRTLEVVFDFLDDKQQDTVTIYKGGKYIHLNYQIHNFMIKKPGTI